MPRPSSTASSPGHVRRPGSSAGSGPVLGGAAVLLVLVLIAGGMAAVQSNHASRHAADARAAAEAARLAAVSADAGRVGARSQLTDDISLSLLLAAAGARLDDSPETRVNLLTALEKMACGLPVIATGCSALCDFMTPENSYPLAVDRLVAAKAKCPYYQGFRWAEPSHKDLRRLMRHVYDNQEEARARGERASLDVRNRWTWDHAAEKITDRLDAIARSRSC